MTDNLVRQHVDLTDDERTEFEVDLFNARQVIVKYQGELSVQSFIKKFATNSFEMSPEEHAIVSRVTFWEPKIVRGYLKLLTRYSNKIAGDAFASHKDDMFSEGYMALQRAMYGYDRLSVRFTTYATWAVQRAMLKYREELIKRRNSERFISELETNDDYSFDAADEKTALVEDVATLNFEVADLRDAIKALKFSPLQVALLESLGHRTGPKSIKGIRESELAINPLTEKKRSTWGLSLMRDKAINRLKNYLTHKEDIKQKAKDRAQKEKTVKIKPKTKPKQIKIDRKVAEVRQLEGNPIELALSIRSLTEQHGIEECSIARLYNKPVQVIEDLLSLLDLPLKVRSKIADGNIEFGEALRIAHLSRNEQMEYAKSIAC